MTLQQVATALGVSRQHVHRWEAGLHEPGALRLAELCRVLNVSADKLLDCSPT